MKLTIFPLFVALVISIVPLSQAKAGTYICTVIDVGPNGVDTLDLRATLSLESQLLGGAWAVAGTTKKVTLPSKEYLAVALTAVSSGKKLKVNLDETTTPLWTCINMYVQN